MEFLRNYSDLMIALVIIAIALIAFILIKKLIIVRLKKYTQGTLTVADDELVNILDKYLMPLFLVGVLYFTLKRLECGQTCEKLIDQLSFFAITLIAAHGIIRGIIFGVLTGLSKKIETNEHAKKYQGFIVLLKTTLWVLAAIFILDNLGFKISTMVAGLGIGGIAIALAAQALLGDLFNYFVIIFDEPFKVGDFIVFGENMGTVDTVGIKTTRIQCLSGERMILSNTDLMSCKIRNFQQMTERRVVFSISVVYKTTYENLLKIPPLIQQAIHEQTNTRFDRCNLSQFGNLGVNFETVYYILSGDYGEYMRTNEFIHLKIYTEFSKHGIEFAFLTPTTPRLNIDIN